MKPHSKQARNHRWTYWGCKKDWKLGVSTARSLRRFFKKAYHKTVRRQVKIELKKQTENKNI